MTNQEVINRFVRGEVIVIEDGKANFFDYEKWDKKEEITELQRHKIESSFIYDYFTDGKKRFIAKKK